MTVLKAIVCVTLAFGAAVCDEAAISQCEDGASSSDDISLVQTRAQVAVRGSGSVSLLQHMVEMKVAEQMQKFKKELQEKDLRIELLERRLLHDHSPMYNHLRSTAPSYEGDGEGDDDEEVKKKEAEKKQMTADITEQVKAQMKQEQFQKEQKAAKDAKENAALEKFQQDKKDKDKAFQAALDNTNPWMAVKGALTVDNAVAISGTLANGGAKLMKQWMTGKDIDWEKEMEAMGQQLGIQVAGMINPGLGIAVSMLCTFLGKPDNSQMKAYLKMMDGKISAHTSRVNRLKMSAIVDEVLWIRPLLEKSASADVRLSYLLTVQHDLATKMALIFHDSCIAEKPWRKWAPCQNDGKAPTCLMKEAVYQLMEKASANVTKFNTTWVQLRKLHPAPELSTLQVEEEVKEAVSQAGSHAKDGESLELAAGLSMDSAETQQADEEKTEDNADDAEKCKDWRKDLSNLNTMWSFANLHLQILAALGDHNPEFKGAIAERIAKYATMYAAMIRAAFVVFREERLDLIWPDGPNLRGFVWDDYFSRQITKDKEGGYRYGDGYFTSDSQALKLGCIKPGETWGSERNPKDKSCINKQYGIVDRDTYYKLIEAKLDYIWAANIKSLLERAHMAFEELSYESNVDVDNFLSL